MRLIDGGEGLSHEELERILHETMDEYAGGATAHYELTESRLIIARDKLKACPVQAIDLKLPTQILESDVSLRAKCTKHETVWEIRNGKHH